MKLGLNTGFFAAKYDERQSVEQVASAGFSCCDYSLYLYAVRGSVYESGDWRNHLKSIKGLADSLGVSVHQMHAPLLKYVNEEPDEAFKMTMTHLSFEACEILDCRYLVIHPRKFRGYDTVEQKQAADYNLEYYRSFLPLAEKHHVTVALENMFRYDVATGDPMDTTFQTAEEMQLFLEKLPSEYFAACVDAGHANINSIEPAAMIDILGENVEVLHIHDNLKIADSHFPPYCGSIDWKGLMEGLKNNHFTGVFSFELMPQNDVGVEALAKYLRELGHRMTREM